MVCVNKISEFAGEIAIAPAPVNHLYTLLANMALV